MHEEEALEELQMDDRWQVAEGTMLDGRSQAGRRSRYGGSMRRTLGPEVQESKPKPSFAWSGTASIGQVV